jgi:ABC-2 type transport system permease protein
VHRNVRLIAVNEVRQRLRSKAFRVGFVVMALMVGAAAVLPGVLAKDSKRETRKVAIVGVDVPDIKRKLLVVEFQPVTKRSEGVLLLESKKVDVLVTPTEAVVRKNLNYDVEQVLQEFNVNRVISERAKSNQIDPAQVDKLLEPIRPLTLVKLNKEDQVDPKVTGLSSVAQILMLLAISLFGTTVLNGVLQEKTSRVVEVVLSTVTPRQLLAGKLIGIGFFALAQVFALSVLALVSVNVTNGTELPSSTAATIVTFLICFLFGFAFYASLFAAAGALASRVEDAQAVATPVTVLLTAAYAVATVISVAPNTQFAKIMTYVPPAAPSVMIARVAGGRVAWWEMLLSAIVMTASVILVVLFAARVYSGAALRIGAKVKLRDALANER